LYFKQSDFVMPNQLKVKTNKLFILFYKTTLFL